MIDFHSQLEEQFPGKNYIPTVYNSAELQDNLEHSGGITISWNAATDDEIPLGAYVKYPLPAAGQTEAEAGTLRYILLDPYAPSKESAIPHYQYQPQFKHPQNMLDRIPFWIKSLDAEGKSINLETTSYTGYPYIIAKKLCDFINSEYVTETGDSFFAATIGNTWSYEIPATLNQEGLIQSSHVIIKVGFDGCSIKSAANAIADAMGCNVFWDWKTKVIRFKVGSTIQIRRRDATADTSRHLPWQYYQSCNGRWHSSDHQSCVQRHLPEAGAVHQDGPPAPVLSDQRGRGIYRRPLRKRYSGLQDILEVVSHVCHESFADYAIRFRSVVAYQRQGSRTVVPN